MEGLVHKRPPCRSLPAPGTPGPRSQPVSFHRLGLEMTEQAPGEGAGGDRDLEAWQHLTSWGATPVARTMAGRPLQPPVPVLAPVTPHGAGLRGSVCVPAWCRLCVCVSRSVCALVFICASTSVCLSVCVPGFVCVCVSMREQGCPKGPLPCAHCPAPPAPQPQ